MSFIDIHAHVIPGVDDGARTLDMAIEMLALALADGISAIVATPHAASISRAEIESGVDALRASARDHGCSLDILIGSEVRFEANLAERFRAGELVTINETSYLLLELSLRADWSPFIQQAIYELRVAGAVPILAHAERYPAVQRNPDVLLDLVEQGVLIQVNSTSITGSGGRASATAAETLLRRRMVHVIASDCHDLHHRPPMLADAHRRVARSCSEDYAAWLTRVPGRIIAGEGIDIPEPLIERRRGSFWRWPKRG